MRRVEAPLAQRCPACSSRAGSRRRCCARRAIPAPAPATPSGHSRRRGWNGRRPIRSTDARAAAALLRYGDKRARAKALARIKPALARTESAAIAIPALGALANSGAAEMDAAGVCELTGGAKALREGEPAAREAGNDELRDSGVQLAQESPLREGAGRDRGRHRHAGAGTRARPLHAGHDRGQRARQAGARVDGGQGRHRARGRRDRVRQARRWPPGALPAAAAAAGHVARRARRRRGRDGPLLRRARAAVRAAAVQGARRPRAGGDGARAGTPQVAGIGRHAGEDDDPPRRRAAPGGHARSGRTQGRSRQGAAAKAFESIRHDAYASAELRGLVYADAPPEELLKQRARSGARARWATRRCCGPSATPRRATG